MAKAITMNERNLRVALAILAQQGETKKWGTTEHAACIRNVAQEIMAESKGDVKVFRPAFMTALLADGLGGNASQFRQKLAALGHVPKAAEAEVEGYD